MTASAFARALQATMKQQGLTAADMSRRTGLYEAYFSRLFSGTVKEPTWKNACLMIDALGISVSDFKLLYEAEAVKQTEDAAEEDQSYRTTLAHCLEQKGMSPAELAEKVDCPRSTISALLSGRAKEPTLTTAKAIADALGVSLEEMARGSHEG